MVHMGLFYKDSRFFQWFFRSQKSGLSAKSFEVNLDVTLLIVNVVVKQDKALDCNGYFQHQPVEVKDY
jgi:hypothetical protein